MADYTGPIEDVRPGDILSWDRHEEYQEFMRKKHGMRNVKIWGWNEEYKDSGARPFATNISPAKPKEPEEPNPFD